VAVQANRKEQLGKSILERGVRLLPATSGSTADGRPPAHRGYDAYVQDPVVAAVVQVRADGKPAITAPPARPSGHLSVDQIRADRHIPEEVAVLDNESMRILDNAVATTHVAAQLGRIGVAMPPPTVQAAHGQESLRYTLPRLGTPAEGEPSLARTMAVFDPKSGAKSLSLSGTDFARLYDTVMRKFSNLDRHTRIAMSELLRGIRAEHPGTELDPAVVALSTHLIESVRQHKLILGHETAIALGMLRPPTSSPMAPPLFPIHAAIANASQTSADDELRKHVEKRDRPDEGGAPAAKKGRTQDGAGK
jgi:hypothetical protein